MIDSEPLVVAVRPDHPVGRRASVTLSGLRDLPLVTLTPGSGLRAVLENAGRSAGFRPRIVAETAELGSLVELAAGLGVALLSRSVATAGEPRVAVLELTRPGLGRRTALAWHHGPISPAGRAFLTLAEQVLRPRVDDAA